MFFGAEITGIGIFRHLKTLIRKQPLVVFRKLPILGYPLLDGRQSAPV